MTKRETKKLNDEATRLAQLATQIWQGERDSKRWQETEAALQRVLETLGRG